MLTEEKKNGNSEFLTPGDDPLREKLAAFEREPMGEEAGAIPGADEAAAEAEKEERTKRANFVTNMVLGGISFLSNQAAKARGDHWRITPEEAEKLDDAIYPVSLKYVESVWLPVWVDQYKEEMMLGWALASILYAKYDADQMARMKEAKAREEAKI